MAGFLGRTLNLHRAAQLSRVFVTRVSSKLQALACQTGSCVFCNLLYVTNISGIRRLGVFARCICTTAYISNLATVDIDAAIVAKGNLGTGGLAAFGLLVADGRDALQVFCQLDLQLTLIRAVDADVAFCQVALRTADDIESVVQLLGNFFSIITLELQAIIKGCRFVFGSFWILIHNACHGLTVFAIKARCSCRSEDVCHAVLTIQSDMTFGSIYAIDTIDAFDGHTILAILALDGDAILAVDADTSFTILATDADAASSTRLTIFSILAVYSNLLGRHILIHEDRDVAIFIDLRSQIISCVFMAGFLVSALNLHRAAQLSRIFVTRVSSKLQALACQIGLSRFQLAYVDCVCIIDTGSDMDDTAFLILITDGKDTTVIIAFQKIVNFYLAIGT